MKGRMLASVVMTAIGASLLAAAMFASTAAGAGAVATAKKGGTITIVAYLALALAISLPLTIVVLASGGALTWMLAARRRVATIQGTRLTEGQERLYRAASGSLAGSAGGASSRCRA